jgi:hypothetical protein
VCLAVAIFQHPDDAVAGPVQVLAGVSAVRRGVAREGEDEGAVHAFGVEDVQQLAQIGGLLVLVADVVPVQP